METKKEPYSIYFEPALSAVVMEWDGYATSSQFREGTEIMLQLLVENNVSKVLADIKDLAIIGTEDQRWLDTFFLPRAVEAGFKTIAIIRPDAYFSKVVAESISYKGNGNQLTIRFFDTIEEAGNWLKGV